MGGDEVVGVVVEYEVDVVVDCVCLYWIYVLVFEFLVVCW